MEIKKHCAVCGSYNAHFEPLPGILQCGFCGVGRPINDNINHPSHYGGDTAYETIKVIEAWELGFCLGNAVKYISRAGKKGDRVEDLKKAVWYLQREIDRAMVDSKPDGEFEYHDSGILE